MAGALLHPAPLYRSIYSQIINLLSYLKNHQMQEDSLAIFTLHVDHLRRTGRRTDRRPYGILSIDTLYRLRFRITTFRVGLENFFG